MRILVVFLAFFSAWAASADALRGPITMVDGDTLRVGASQNLRLVAIDAVETDQTCETEQGVLFACGAWVTRTVKAAFNGRHAVCALRGIDRYDRPLVTCRVDGGDLGARLVREGWARTYRENTTYAAQEKEAVLMARGLWSFVMQDPAVHRQTRVRGRHAPDPRCVIKGNISGNGRIYHVPGNEHYDRTGIRTDKGERWFCTEAEARAAGWRPARR